MKEVRSRRQQGHDFAKKNKVSVWVSQHPYKDIPDDYFEETFLKNSTLATNVWSENFNLNHFDTENLEHKWHARWHD